MHLYKLAIGMMVGLILSVVAGSVEAKELKIKGSFSGGFSPSDFDFTQDGQKASLNLTTSKSNLGRFTHQNQSEYLLPLPAPVTCPQDTVEFLLRGSNTVATNTSTGDQLLSIGNSGTLCVNPSTGTFTFQVTENYFGGTGRFTGASGSVQISGTGLFHVCDPAGRCFGSETGTFTGTLTLPNGKGD
jgi:hypothetical protein